MCNACGDALERPQDSRLDDVKDPQSGQRFAILRCATCGLGHTSPSPEDLGAYYGPAYYGGRHSFTAQYCASRRVRILEQATWKKRGKLLDIGCGDGSFLSAAVARGWSI